MCSEKRNRGFIVKMNTLRSLSNYFREFENKLTLKYLLPKCLLSPTLVGGIYFMSF